MSERSWTSGTAASEISSSASAVLFPTVSKVRGWIESPVYDVALFALSPLTGLLLILVDHMSRWGHAAGELAIYFIGIPHYLSTFTFYLGDQNRDQYRLRWAAFFLGPLVIFSCVLGLRTLAVRGIVQAVIFVWNVYHVSLQSAGVLSLYRRLNGGDQGEKRWAHLTILSLNATMAFWYVKYFPPLYDLLVLVHPLTPMVLRYVCLAAVLVAGTGYLVHLRRRSRPLSVPEKVFLISSLLLFHPYLWVKNYLLATIAMLMGHFIQYLGIIWLLNRRKYGQQSSGTVAQQWLIRLSSRPRLLFVSLLLLGGFFLSIDRGSRLVGMYLSYTIVWNSLVLIHFYVDGLVWAFRDSFVRKTVGPLFTSGISPGLTAMRSMRTTVVPDPTGDQMLAFGGLLARSGKAIEVEISGTSMGSTLPSGCRIRICPLSTEKYQAGQVVAFVAGSAFIAHRIVYRSREGVLTRGDSHTWCDVPFPVSAILGVVSECQVDGEWRLLDDKVSFACELRKRNGLIETLLRVCLRIDIGLAQRASRMLMRLARLRQRLVPKHVPTQ